MKKFFQNLLFIFQPSYWLMNEKYNKDTDDLMNYLLDNFTFKSLGSEQIAQLGPFKIWIGNRPYSCMMPFDPCVRLKGSGRPSRLTIQKGIKKLKKEIKLLDTLTPKEIVEIAINENKRLNQEITEVS